MSLFRYGKGSFQSKTLSCEFLKLALCLTRKNGIELHEGIQSVPTWDSQAGGECNAVSALLTLHLNLRENKRAPVRFSQEGGGDGSESSVG
jgi:hypothetical protein